MEQKTVSFIIPSYNVERYLRHCLESFLHPDVLSRIEVIVVNDGSSDGTERIALEFAERWPDTFRVHTQENGGHGAALNTGTRLAQGRYLKAVDADDWVVTENLPQYVDKLEKCTADVVLTPYHQVDMKTGRRSAWDMFLPEYERTCTFDDVMADWKAFDRCLVYHGITYRTEFYQKYRHELPEKIFYEDNEYATIPCAHAKSIWPVHLFLYQYQVGNSGQSVAAGNRLKRMGHVEQVTKDLIRYYNAHTELPAAAREYIYRKTEGVILSYYMAACILNPDKRKGREDCRRYSHMIGRLNRDFLARVWMRYRIFECASRLHLSPGMYRKILDSRLYRIVRRNHKIESEG